MTKKKLWQTSSELHPLIETYTVGEDFLLDQRLVPYDVVASMAHMTMLLSKGVITQEEFDAGKKGFSEIGELHKKGMFTIDPSQEDMHTAIEQYLTENYGSIGSKIHTGRSRNDQILVALRLYMKDALQELNEVLSSLIVSLETKSKESVEVKMPGYTHYQRAMPTTVGIWLGSYVDALSDMAQQIQTIDTLIDQSPLGSASGYGIGNFENDREFTASELGFSKVQENPIYCGASRGLFEFTFLQRCEPVMLLLGRLATDLLLFSTSEFGFFRLSDNLTTGSSIMPQKRNWDVCEILRGNQSVYSGYVDQIKCIYSHLMSGYQRDLQLTKKPFLEGVDLLISSIEVSELIITHLEWDEEKLASAMDESLYLTNELYERVNNGEDFRSAYKFVKESYFSED